MTLAIAILLAGAQAPAPQINNYDPPGAEGWEQAAEFRCGGTTLRVEGYGMAKPSAGSAAVTIDRVDLEGAAANALRKDLSNRRAVYRLGARCPKESSSIALVIVSGEKTEGGEVAYRSGAALIKGNRIQSYTGLQEAAADGFWFR